MRDALNAVVEHVQIRLNLRYQKSDICFEIAERTTIIHHERCNCNNVRDIYCHITIRCLDNIYTKHMNCANIQLQVCEPMEVVNADSGDIGARNDVDVNCICSN